MMTNIIIANTTQDYKLIAELADTIWREHYTNIIGLKQVEYMLAKFQTSNAISKQIKEGYQYFIINYNKKSVGYISIKIEKKSLFLSKIYILKECRGKSIGKIALLFIDNKAEEYNLNKVSLTVNKGNTNTIKAYEKIGFVNMGRIDIDIGNGFVMDDYKMEKTLSN